jgi:trimeric autotransporter adhesin
VKFHLNRFLRRVRIHGGEFDTSARAMYRVSEKGSLISYEKAFSTRADLRIVRGSTIERKQMSTKTTFKRIALVTVAALGFGTMAAVSPASANTTLTTVKVSDATVYGYVGDTLTAAVKVTAVGAAGAALGASDSITLTAALSSYSGSALAAGVLDSMNADSSTSASQLDVNKFRLQESSTAGILFPTAAVDKSTRLKLAGLDTKTAFTAANLVFRPSTPGSYKITVTPSNVQAGGAAVYTAGVITFVVLSAGAVTTDGALVASRATANGVAGVGNYNQVRITGQLHASSLLGTRVVVTGSTIEGVATELSGTLSTDKTVLTVPGVITGSIKQGLINVLTPTVGTVTVQTFRETAVGTYSTTADNTVTITVRAAALTGTPTNSTTYMATGATAPDETTDAAVVALTSVPSQSALVDSPATALARIQVIQYDALEAVADSSKTLAVTAEITGAGRIGQSSTAADATSIIAIPAGSATTPQGPTDDFYVFSDGRSGEATITIKVGGVTTLTRKVAFFGTATQLKLVAPTAAVPNPTKSFLAVAGTMDISVLPYDANNVKLAPAAVTATSETATVATVVTKAGSTGVVTVTGVAVGKTNITIKSGTSTLVVPVEVTKSTGKAVLTLDKTSAQPGEKVTWTITATDTNGRPTADGTSIALFSSITSNMSVVGLPTGTETLTGGVSTGSFFAPVSGSGTLQITATHGTAHDTYIAGQKAATAANTTYTAVKDVVELAIANAAVDAATAAAELAEAAAQDATDAALDATEAATLAGALAQEAVDAVADLSTQVATLIAALKKQITTLTNLVIKIQKKVRA